MCTCGAEGDAVTHGVAFEVAPLSVLAFDETCGEGRGRGLIRFSLPTSWYSSALFLTLSCPPGLGITLLHPLVTQ